MPGRVGAETVDPAVEDPGVGEDVEQSDADDRGVQQQVHRHEGDGDADGVIEAQQEHPAEDEQHDDGDRDGLAVETGRQQSTEPAEA